MKATVKTKLGRIAPKDFQVGKVYLDHREYNSKGVYDTKSSPIWLKYPNGEIVNINPDSQTMFNNDFSRKPESNPLFLENDVFVEAVITEIKFDVVKEK